MSDASSTLRSIPDLVAAGLVRPDQAAGLEPVGARYAVAVTPSMAALIDPADPADPIARQLLPDRRELVASPEERPDPIGDHTHEPVPGLVHRYPDRVLLKLTLACPVYCRFCFRREMVGPGGPPPMTGERLAPALDYIRSRSGITEVILTGGDPLMLSARRIAEVTSALAAIPHVAVLRWHSRVPVVDPGRVTTELARALAAPARPVWIAIHTNHVREITEEARSAILRLAAAGHILLSQTVLLKGVNNDAATLADLFTTLISLGVKPYYLHHADLAPGTRHFRTSVAEGQDLVRALRGRISGLALPTYVLDVPGGAGKVPLGPSYIDDRSAATVLDPLGRQHTHPDL
jgi:lysine 2,3-aminomutase